ncbi:unnamed protein product [Clavelina lepadiformis]
MSDSNLLKEQMRHVVTSLTSTDETMVKGSYVAETFAQAAKHRLLLALSQITNPFFSALIFILQLVAMMWAPFYTIGFIRSSPHHLQHARSLVSRIRGTWRQQHQAPVAHPQQTQPSPMPRSFCDQSSLSGPSDDAPHVSSSLDDTTSDTPAVASPSDTFVDFTRPDSPFPQSSPSPQLPLIRPGQQASSYFMLLCIDLAECQRTVICPVQKQFQPFGKNVLMSVLAFPAPPTTLGADLPYWFQELEETF